MKTIQSAKQYIKENRIKGVNCPCCGQFVKVYTRRLYAGMAYELIRLYNLHKGTNFEMYIHHKFFSDTRINGISKLKHWGLVEEKINTDTKKRTSGYWKITKLGINFVLNKIAVYEKIILYKNEFQSFKGEKVKITDCLGTKFNYTELMSIN